MSRRNPPWWPPLILFIPVLFFSISFWLFTAALRVSWERETSAGFDRQAEHLSSAKNTESFWASRCALVLDACTRKERPDIVVRTFVRNAKRVLGCDVSAALWDRNLRRLLYLTPDLASRPVSWPSLFQACERAAQPKTRLADVRTLPGIGELNKVFGYIVFPEYLRHARDIPPRLIPPRPAPGEPWSWYDSAGPLAFLVRFPPDILDQPYGLRLEVRKLRTSFSPLPLSESGLALVSRKPDGQLRVFEHAGDIPLSELGKHARALETSSTSDVDDRNHRWRIRMQSPDVYLVQCRKKSFLACWGGHPAIPLGILLLGTFAIAGFYRPLQERLERRSLTWDLLLLLLLANVLPLLLFWLFSEEYRSQQAQSLISDNHRQVRKLLLAIDSQFPLELRIRERFLDRLLGRLDRTFPRHPAPQAVRSWLAREVRELEPSHFHGYSDPDKLSITADGVHGPGFQATGQNLDFFRECFHFLLESLRGGKHGAESPDLFATMLEALLQRTSVDIVREFLEGNGRIRPLGFGERSMLTYVRLLPGFDGQPWQRVLSVTFDEERLQREYLARLLPILNRNPDRRTFLAIETRRLEGGMPVPEERPDAAFWNRHRDFFRGLGPEPTVFTGESSREKLEPSLVAMRGRILDRFLLAAVSPLDAIREADRRATLEWIVLFGMNLLVSLIIGMMLRHRVLVPMDDLMSGIGAIRRRAFPCQIPVRSDDELGAMATSFNRVLEECHDLHLAGLVQEALVPRASLVTQRIHVAGRSFSMREIGGDFLDCILSGSDSVMLLIGDAVGHGAPAALMMAMAKTVILQNPHLWSQPEKLFEMLHGIIRSTQDRSRNQFMTFQYIEIDLRSGTGTLLNAGHPFPFLIRGGGVSHPLRTGTAHPTVETWKGISLPLGALDRIKFHRESFRLRSGDALFLWTDGLAESPDPQGTPLGFKGLENLVQMSFQNDPEAILSDVFRAIRPLQALEPGLASDDMTAMAAIYSGPEKES